MKMFRMKDKDEKDTTPVAVYDTVEGIESYLTDLDGLNRLIRDRSVAGYQRHERLHDYVIMGKWSTDSCGNFGPCKITLDYKPCDLAERLPKVIASADIYKMLNGISISSGSDPHVPLSRLLCSECSQGWTLENAHDAIQRKEDRIVPLTPGQSVADRQRDWDYNTEGVFRFGSEPGIRNAKFIDLTPHPKYKNSVINEKGWRYHHPPFADANGAGERVGPDYIAEEGDESSITVFMYLHSKCFELRKSRLERETFVEAFATAGMPNAILNEIPNGYCPCEYCPPWFIAKLPFGDIKMGWRKRVINIEWPSNPKATSKLLFPEEDVTKEDFLIHAYGWGKAVEYLTKIRQACT